MVLDFVTSLWEIGDLECDCLVVGGKDWSSWLIWMLGSVGGVFSASELGILGFWILCLEENDLGRRFLMEEEEMLPKKGASAAVSALLLRLMMVSLSKQKDQTMVVLYRHREREREREREKHRYKAMNRRVCVCIQNVRSKCVFVFRSFG